MPEIRIQYRARQPRGACLRREEVQQVIALLREECQRRFTLDWWPLTTADFSFSDEPQRGASSLTHDVIVRIYLHHFKTRVALAQSNANELQALLEDLLNSEHRIEWRGRLKVGVGITLSEIAWAGGQTHDA